MENKYKEKFMKEALKEAKKAYSKLEIKNGAVVCSDTTSARFSRLHNDANILCFGERIIGEYLAKDICDIWLNTEFEKDRHLKRVNLIEENLPQ